MNKKNVKQLPHFTSEDEIREFWDTQDSTEYVDFSKAVKGRFPNLKPSSTTMTIRMPQYLIDDIKILANKKDVPYQSLIKLFLEEKVAEERLKERKTRSEYMIAHDARQKK